MSDEIKDNASTVTAPADGVQGVFPGQVHELPGGGIMLSKLDELINWARSNSLWPLTFCHQLLRYRIYGSGRRQI